MKYLLPCILLTFSIASYGQMTIDTASSKFIYDSVTNSSTDFSMYLGGNDSTTGLSFDTITINDFLNYKKKYDSKIDTDSSILIWTDSSFIIRTENWKTNFNTRITDDFPWNYYLGFLKPLSLFIVLNIDGRNELGTLLLIDWKTGKTYYFSSPFDDPCQTALISRKNNYLLSYSNDGYRHNQCFISILKIDRNKKHYKLNGFISMDISGWTITELVWINENSFALKVREKTDLTNYDWESGEDHYLKASFAK